MLLVVALWSLVLAGLMEPGVHGFECQEQSSSQEGTCHCELSGQPSYQYDIFCPYVTDSKIHFKFEEDKFIVMTCSHSVTFPEILGLLRNLRLEDVPSFSLVNCPVPVDPFASLFSDIGLNVTKIEYLKMQFVGQQSSQDLLGYHFQNLTSLKVLGATRMRIKKIDKTFFEHIPQLKSVDFTQNKGIQIEGSSLLGLSLLEEFTCHSCFLQDLPGNMFTGLSRLRMVSLHDNKIKTIMPGTFDTTTAMESINLQKNILTSLPVNVFDNLVNLSSVLLSYNDLDSLPDGLFRNNKKVKMFELSVNGKKNPLYGLPISSAKKMKLPSSAFPDTLEEIRMLWVPVSGVPEDFLKGCKGLVNITIQRSMISSLPENLFQETPNVKLIDFSANDLSSLPPKLFRNLGNMEKIRVLGNKLTNLDGGLFLDLKKLKIVHLHENEFESLPRQLFSTTKKLEELDLSKNKINFNEDSIERFYKAGTFQSLKKLDMSYNNIGEIPQEMTWNFLGLKVLNLSHNTIGESYNDGEIPNLQFHQFNDFDFVVDLSHNQIKRMTYNQFIDSENSNLKPAIINITNNPLICDCKTVVLKQMVAGEAKSPLDNIAKFIPEDVKCGENNSRLTRNKFLSEVRYRDLDCAAECVDPCRCSINTFYKETHMDCSGKKLTQFPSKLILLPGSNTISLDMSNNRVQNVSFAVERFYQDTNNETLHYKNITRLNLSHNQISIFHQECMPPYLQELNLDNNLISSFRQSDVNFFDRLIDNSNLTMKFGNNPYSCTCDSKAIYHFVRNRGGKIQDRNQLELKCGGDKGDIPMWSVSLEDFCVPHLPMGLVILIISLIVIVLCMGLAFFLFAKRDIVVIWLYAQPIGRKFFSEDLIDKEKPYDAFISYSQADSEYVETSLLPGLEQPESPGDKFKCLIHTRDWNVGEMIPDQIIHSVESSRRTIIVLSKSYIDSMWTKLEFRAAHKQALQDKTQRVIIVVLGELPTKDDMEDDLKKYISLNTYLEAGDPWFWQKLRFALPHRGRMAKSRTRRETDKLELMRSQAELELGKRTPSPKNLDVKTLLTEHQSIGHANGGFSNGHANGHAMPNGNINV